MKTSLFKSLYFQVLTAIAIGILLGHYYPELGAQMKPLGDGFVKLIKMGLCEWSRDCYFPGAAYAVSGSRC